MRIPAGFGALLCLTVLLTGCDSVAPSLACKVEVDTPELIGERQAAGVADCDQTAWDQVAATSQGRAVEALPDLALGCLGSIEQVALNQIPGPAILNFWASNCGPCRKEMPALQEFHQAYGDQVNLIGVNYLDTYPGAAIDLARISGVTYPSLADACGDLQETDMQLGIGMPWFLFIKADGTLAGPPVHGGLDSLEEIVTLAQTQLGIELAPAPEAAS